MGKGKASDCHCEEVFAAEIYNISQQNDVANLSVSRRSRETFQKGAVATGLPAPGAQTLLFAAFVMGVLQKLPPCEAGLCWRKSSA